MNSLTTSPFALPERLIDKADPALIGGDEEHLASVAATLDAQVADLTTRLDTLRRAPGGRGRGAMDRDLEIHRLTARLGIMRRFGIDACLGRMVDAATGRTTYVGRFGLTDPAGRRLLVDWRTPAAEPFFAATLAHPLGLASRRRYRWVQRRISDYWDEVFTTDETAATAATAALDADSAFIASLGTSRSEQMRDVLATIAADQDAIIRAESRGALVVDGGPGTGKTVVALHRAAYLLYADPRLRGHRGGLLYVGPHRPYLAYIADVLPSLGEEGVQTCTLADLVPEGATARPEGDPEAARLKASLELVAAIEPAVGLYEEPPRQGLMVDTEWGDFWISATDWVDAFTAPDPGTPHNQARAQIWETLLDLVDDDEEDPEVAPETVRRALRDNAELNETLNRAWTLVAAADLVADLWSVPAYLHRCAPGLTRRELASLHRESGSPWTVSDLPLLDAARHRLGDPEAERLRRRREAADAAERAAMDRVVEDLLSADDDPEGSMQLLRRASIRTALVDEDAAPRLDPDQLAGPFAHIVVDEAQELTDAEWQMLLRRCPSRSFTIVGDRAQARHDFAESWAQRLHRVGFDAVRHASLSINYRTPAEVMAAAEPVIRAVFPDANVPTSVRRSGIDVAYRATTELESVLDDWRTAHADGIACVIGRTDPDERAERPRTRFSTPETVKGLEFDLVVLVGPEGWGTDVEATVDRYVAMTRATQQLVVLTTG